MTSSIATSDRATAAERVLSLGVSIVLFRTHVLTIQPLLEEMLKQGAAQIYVVDNSPLTFDSFAGWTPHPRITTIRTGLNLGYGRANNIAIRDSILRHEYHVVSNPDIRLGANVLPHLCEVMASRSDVGLISPRVIGFDGAPHYLCKRSPSPMDFAPWFMSAARRRARREIYEMRDHSYDEAFEAECLSGCFMFARSSVLQHVGGFDERFFMYLEDFDLSRRTRRLARNLYYPDVHVFHAHARGHRRSLRLLRAFGASALKYFTKWGWLESAASREGASRAPSRRPGA